MAKTLESVLDQSLVSKEIIVVDDQSTDGTWSVALKYQKAYPEIIQVHKNQQKGGNAARNLAFSLSTGSYIQWLDSDDIILPGKLEQQVEFLNNNKEYDAVFSDWQLDTYSEDHQLIKTEKKSGYPYKDYLWELLRDNWSPPHSYLMSRAAAGKTVRDKGWNTGTEICQDREFYTVAAIHGIKFGYVKGNFSIYNRWRKNQSVSRAKSPRERASHLVVLLQSFVKRIENEKRITSNLKSRYKELLITEILYHVSCYDLPTVVEKIPFVSVKWGHIKGLRSKLKVIKLLSKS